MSLARVCSAAREPVSPVSSPVSVSGVGRVSYNGVQSRLAVNEGVLGSICGDTTDTYGGAGWGTL